MNSKDTEPIRITFRRDRRHERIVLVNCLDYLYGHSLLKLLNTQYYLDHHTDLACCVLTPKPLAHLVPNGVAEIWQVDIGFRAMQHWYVSLEEQIREEIEVRKECYLSVGHSHPHCSRYNLDRFVKTRSGLDEFREKYPVIVFIYREDRLWGRSVAQQQRNIRILYLKLKLAFPTLQFVVTGFGRNSQLPADVRDDRVDHSSDEQEQRWLDIFARSDCVVGVHGSNMLLPSGLSRHVVELLPEDRLGNFAQDLLWPGCPPDGVSALHRVRMVPGRPNLSDVRPELIASVVIHQVGGDGLLMAQMNASIWPVDPLTDRPDTLKISATVSKETIAYARLVRSYDQKANRFRMTLQRLVTRHPMLAQIRTAVKKLLAGLD